jgi:hypothetical protein
MKKTFLGLVALASVFVIAPAVVPMPTMTTAGFEMRVDIAEARCGAECTRRCNVDIANKVYKNMKACVAVWGPINDERRRLRRAARGAFGQAR